MNETRQSDLLTAAVRGDANALCRLLAETGPAVAARLDIAAEWRPLVDADDVMQVTYLEAFLRISDLRAGTPAAFVAWVTRIAQNNLRDAIKELQRAKRPDPRRRVTAAAGDESVSGLLEALGGTASTPSQAVAGRELVRLTRSAVSELPRDYRTVVELYDLEGRSSQEVAQMMGRSEGAIFMLRARAHDCLRQALESDSRFFSGR